MAHFLHGTPPTASQMTMQTVGRGDDSGCLSLFMSTCMVGSSAIDRRCRTFANSNGIGRPDLPHVSARVSAGIMIFRRAVRGQYRYCTYAATSFVTVQQGID
jgi:hypothetical protein